MRTRTFIGLILLVAAMMVASTPALLEPTAQGVERLGVMADVLPDRAAQARRTDEESEERQAVGATDPAFQLRGYEVEDDGDLRDTMPVGERATNLRGRLAPGRSRVALPGERQVDADAPPFAAEDGVLLDVTGCPVFAADADVAALMADEQVKALYATKIGAADDATACETVFAERVTSATAEPTALERDLPGNRRRYANMLRSDSERMYVDLAYIGMFSDMMGLDSESHDELVESLRGQAG